MTRTALVIGGGIAGSVAGVALQRAGFDTVVHEAHQSTAEGVGAFLGLGLNGVSALRALDLDAEVLARGFATPRMVISNGRGRVLADFPNGGMLPDGTRALTISRPDLYSALAAEARRRGVPFVHGKRLVGVEERPDGVRAHFADGGSAEADVLVGADGIGSTTRRLLDPSAPGPRYVGFLNTAGYAAGVNLGVEPGVNHLVFGRRSFFGYVAHPNGDVWWFANPPRRAEPSPDELAAVPAEAWRSHLRDLFRDDRVPALEVIDRTEHISSGWITYDLPPVPTWHTGRTVLIGDAAHAVSPSAGQGASLAIEDAVVLAKCLRDAPDPAAAFRTFEALRRPRVERMVAQGRRNGSGKAAGPVARVFRDLGMPVAMGLMFRGGRDPFRWVWDHRIDWDEPVASHPGAFGG
jgi:2-polyprenyl-6-methoxyphenol hydroxylase-like FAD-dependent oxidoreductase